MFQDSDIRVDIMNGVYRHQPYTLQPGGCGQPGLYVHLTPQYLLDNNEAGWFGPRGMLVQVVQLFSYTVPYIVLYWVGMCVSSGSDLCGK